MQAYCHRCGGELPESSGETPFCPGCGAPQLRLSLENQSAETGGEPTVATANAAGPGVVPPPERRQVEWKTAIRCALLVAAIGAVLGLGAMRVDLLSPVSFLWIMSGSLVTVGLYQKRRPAARIDVRVGARIGLVVGLLMALGLGLVLAAWGLAMRYGLHAAASFDAQMAEQLQKAIRQSATPIPADKMGFVLSPEFRAGAMLAGSAFLTGCLLLLSMLGGAFAGLLRTRRGPAV